MIKKPLAVLMILVLCLVAISCRTPAGRTPGTVIDDSTITTEVKAKLFEEGVLKGLAISVSTFEGAVTLTGAVKTPEQKRRAGEIAQGVKGVKKVNNLLSVRPA